MFLWIEKIMNNLRLLETSESVFRAEHGVGTARLFGCPLTIDILPGRSLMYDVCRAVDAAVTRSTLSADSSKTQSTLERDAPPEAQLELLDSKLRFAIVRSLSANMPPGI